MNLNLNVTLENGNEFCIDTYADLVNILNNCMDNNGPSSYIKRIDRGVLDWDTPEESEQICPECHSGYTETGRCSCGL